MTESADVVIIGGGTSGENVAWYATDNGLSVILVENHLLGGACTYYACTPSKMMLRPGEALKEARSVAGASAAVTGELDVAAVLAARDVAINNLDDSGQAKWLASTGSELVRGTARISGERTVEVTSGDGSTTQLRAHKAVVVATGSSAASPPIPGLDEVGWWDSNRMTTADRIPDRLLIIGGGVVGAELAQAARSLGASEVTIVQRGERILPTEEPFASELVAEALREDGITILLNADTKKAERHGEVVLTLADGTTLTGDEVLVATGRRPNTHGLGLESVGLEAGAWIEVDDRLRSSHDWLYAVGDVNGRALFTHQGKYQARIAADVIAGKDRSAWADHRAMPRVIFTDPQVASVGLTEAQARRSGMDVKILKVGYTSVAASWIHTTQPSGAAQLVVDRSTDTIAGATFVGPQVAELMHAATIAIVAGATLDQLWHAVPAFPTISELWLRLLEADRGIS